VNVYKISADVYFRPSFGTYRRRVDLLRRGSNFIWMRTKMKLKLVIFGFLTYVPLLFSFIMSCDKRMIEESLSNIRGGGIFLLSKYPDRISGLTDLLFDWMMQKSGRQIVRVVTEVCKIMPSICGPCSMSPFWGLAFWGVSYIFWKNYATVIISV
jgi:hypothetical protein